MVSMHLHRGNTDHNHCRINLLLCRKSNRQSYEKGQVNNIRIKAKSQVANAKTFKPRVLSIHKMDASFNRIQILHVDVHHNERYGLYFSSMVSTVFRQC
jgi:hypothetical protein